MVVSFASQVEHGSRIIANLVLPACTHLSCLPTRPLQSDLDFFHHTVCLTSVFDVVFYEDSILFFTQEEDFIPTKTTDETQQLNITAGSTFERTITVVKGSSSLGMRMGMWNRSTLQHFSAGKIYFKNVTCANWMEYFRTHVNCNSRKINYICSFCIWFYPKRLKMRNTARYIELYKVIKRQINTRSAHNTTFPALLRVS